MGVEEYAHDGLAVAVTYLAAYVAKKLGVKWYIQQYMMNTPPVCRLKWMWQSYCKQELVDSLTDEGFIPYRMIRTGLLSFLRIRIAQGQLTASMFYASYLQPYHSHGFVL